MIFYEIHQFKKHVTFFSPPKIRCFESFPLFVVISPAPAGRSSPPGVVAQGWGPFPRSQGVEATRPWCPGAVAPTVVGYRWFGWFGSKVFSEVRDTGNLKEVSFFFLVNVLNKEDSLRGLELHKNLSMLLLWHMVNNCEPCSILFSEVSYSYLSEVWLSLTDLNWGVVYVSLSWFSLTYCLQ